MQSGFAAFRPEILQSVLRLVFVVSLDRIVEIDLTMEYGLSARCVIPHDEVTTDAVRSFSDGVGLPRVFANPFFLAFLVSSAQIVGDITIVHYVRHLFALLLI